MEDKRKDLVGTQQKKIITELVETLNRSHPSFYYLSTVEIAIEIKKHIEIKENLSHEKHELVKSLSREDIQILLSFHQT